MLLTLQNHELTLGDRRWRNEKRLQNRSSEAFLAWLSARLRQLVSYGITAVGWVCRA
jgi:hypothetical protein